MKGITASLKSLKDNNRYFKEADINMKELFGQVLVYLDYVNTIMSCNRGGGMSEEENAAG